MKLIKMVIRYIRQLYSGPFQSALVFSFTLVAAVTIGVGTWVISYTINSYLSEVMNERVSRDIHLADTLYGITMSELSSMARQLSLSPIVLDNINTATLGEPEAVQALENKILTTIGGATLGGNHYIAILDVNGITLASQLISMDGSRTTLHASNNWSRFPIVQKTLTEKIQIASTEIVPADLLQYAALAEQAQIALINTPKAAPGLFDPREGTAGLALVSTAPIIGSENRIMGMVLTLHMFNNDFTLVDQIKDAAQIDTVTIFLGDLRVSTNVMTAEGRRAVGTRIAQDVGNVVLVEGREYVGTAFVVNENYITRYEPLRDHNNQIVGSLYVGVRQASFLRLLNTFDQRTTLVAVLTILLTFLLATPVSRMITRPLKDLRELAQTSRRVAGGDLNARAPMTARGEVGLLATSFNDMLDTLHTTRDQLVHSEKLASLGQLAAGVAHELNNPLATILLFSETLMRECAEDDPRRNDLNMIMGETHRCKRIVADLLNFARQHQVIAQPTKVNALIQELIELLPKYIETEDDSIDIHPAFVTELTPLLPVIEADEAQLRQVFLNLMINAVEAMPQGGTLTVRTRNGPPGMITIEIQDTGVGIPSTDQSKLFTPFFTTKPTGKGTGLGLAIVYGIIKMHRGQITVQSQAGRGTTFVITLPVKLLTLETAATARVTSHPTNGNGTLIG
jgi:two-component system NtrC family sensor kinase